MTPPNFRLKLTAGRNLLYSKAPVRSLTGC